MEAIDTPMAEPASNEVIDATKPNPNHSNEVVLDSLPYIDQIHPDYEAYALTLIEEEMQKMEPPPSIPYDATATPVFQYSKHSVNKTEYEHLVKRNGQPRNKDEQMNLDFTQKVKSALPQNTSDKSQWEEAIDRAKIELEYERLRQVNVELQGEFDTSIWKYRAELHESDSKYMKACLEDQLMKVDQINAKRKEMQEVQAAPKLSALTQRWGELIQKNRHLARGVRSLEDEEKGFQAGR
jgi:pre-mRNA-splicing factor SPF27